MPPFLLLYKTEKEAKLLQIILKYFIEALGDGPFGATPSAYIFITAIWGGTLWTVPMRLCVKLFGYVPIDIIL